MSFLSLERRIDELKSSANLNGQVVYSIHTNCAQGLNRRCFDDDYHESSLYCDESEALMIER